MTAPAQGASAAARAYAGIVTRTTAFAIDLLILNGILFAGALVVGLIIDAFGRFSPNLDLGSVVLAAVVWSLAFAIYFTAWWSLTGQTPGMRALGVRVLTVTGDRLRPRRGLLRVIAMVIATIPFFAGYLLILVRDRREGLHDLIARTVVVYVERDQSAPSHRRAVSAP